MKILIVLENHFYKDLEGKIWCDRIVDYNFLKRYLNVFSEIILCGRVSQIEGEVQGKLLVSGKNVEFIGLPNFKGIKGLIRNILRIKSIIKKQLKRVNHVIYRVPTHLSLFTYKQAIKQKKILGIEFMMAADKMIEGKSVITNILNKYIESKAKKICMKANGVAYVTEGILQKSYPCFATIHGNGKKNFTTNYSTIDLEKKDFYIQKWKKDNKPEIINIVHTGYMDSYRKGQITLINAVKNVAQKGYKFKLHLIGDGNKRIEFEELAIKLGIEKYISFEGIIKEKSKILGLLKKCHLFVFPTHSEGLPRSIIEAMAVGLPCISSPVDGIPELLNEEFLINYDDSDKYADKIIELMEDWEKMIKAGHENYEKSKKYSNSNLQKQRNEFYNKLKNM